jgi:hypothetical protein
MLAAVLVLGTAGSALAVSKGGTLYVKAKNTRLMESASPKANTVAILQPGQKVVWEGADTANKQWHRVKVGAKAGVVFQSNLATQPPQMELVAGERVQRIDPQELAGSAAAVKALSEGAIAYGKKKGYTQAVKELQALEQLAQKVEPAHLAEHARTAGLFPVVGPEAGRDADTEQVAEEGEE